MRSGLAFAVVLLASAIAPAQSAQPDDLQLGAARGNTQWVSLEAAPAVTVPTGKSKTVELRFKIQPNHHINSNQPKEESLIPTKLRLEPPTDISIGQVEYPAGHDFAFSFAPQEKLSVYTGEFAVTALLRAARAAPLGTFTLHGELQYQACNDRQCFPPKKLPIAFNVRVVRGPSDAMRHNPPQSPHIHR